jgi:hypothetical protein
MCQRYRVGKHLFASLSEAREHLDDLENHGEKIPAVEIVYPNDRRRVEPRQEAAAGE